jgi:hypothetical protein
MYQSEHKRRWAEWCKKLLPFPAPFDCCLGSSVIEEYSAVIQWHGCNKTHVYVINKINYAHCNEAITYTAR